LLSKRLQDVSCIVCFGRSIYYNAYGIMITTTATTRTMQHIVETIITSHTGIAYHVEHIAEGMPPNHGFVSVY